MSKEAQTTSGASISFGGVLFIVFFNSQVVPYH